MIIWFEIIRVRISIIIIFHSICHIASDVVEPPTVDTSEETADNLPADGHTADVSVNTESSTTATESSVTLDNSLADAASSPEKKKQKKKTKAELKAELKEQKVMERKSRRQRIRNRR